MRVKVDHVLPYCDYITPGKEYEVLSYDKYTCDILDDEGDSVKVAYKNDAHTGYDWDIVEEGKGRRKVYYCHNMEIYGTSIERSEIRRIVDCHCKIFNPSAMIDQEGTEEDIMTKCLEAVVDSDILIFSTIEDDIIGYGQLQEISEAFANNKEVFFLKWIRTSVGEWANIIPFTKEDYLKIYIIHEEGKSKKRYAKVVI